MSDPAFARNASAAPGPRKEHRLQMRQGGMLKLQNCEGLDLLAVEGNLWITQEADVRDYEIGAGQSLRLEHRGVTLIQAMTGATLVLTAAARAPQVSVVGMP